MKLQEVPNLVTSFLTRNHVQHIDKQCRQGSKIALVRSYLRVPQAAGQVKILIFLVKITFFPLYANKFCDAGQVPILRYFEACVDKDQMQFAASHQDLHVI